MRTEGCDGSGRDSVSPGNFGPVGAVEAGEAPGTNGRRAFVACLRTLRRMRALLLHACTVRLNFPWHRGREQRCRCARPGLRRRAQTRARRRHSLRRLAVPLLVPFSPAIIVTPIPNRLSPHYMPLSPPRNRKHRPFSRIVELPSQTIAETVHTHHVRHAHFSHAVCREQNHPNG